MASSGRFQQVRDVMSGFIDVAELCSAAFVEGDDGALSALVGMVLPRTLDDDDASATEELIYGVAGIIGFPKAKDAAGAAEAVFADVGERLVIATRDLRFVIEPLEGETIVHALGADGTRQAQVKLRPDGTAIIEADEVLIGTASASEGIGLGDAIKGHFDALKSSIDGHTHLAGSLLDSTSGPVTGTTGPPVVASPSVPTVASASHKVEP